MVRTTLIFLALLTMAAPAGADSLLLQAGDLLHGQLVQIQDQTVVFRTELAGQLIVPVDEVKTVTANRSMIFELADGRTVPAMLAASDGQQYLVEPERNIRIPVALADIRKTASLPYTASSDNDQPSLLNPEWDTAAELGVSGHIGTRDYIAPYAKLTLRRETDDFDFNGYVRLEMEDTADVPDHVRAALEWDLHRDRRWFPQIYASADRDLAEGRSLRADFGAGVSGTLYEGTASRLTAAAGLGLGYEDLNVRDLKDRGAIGRIRDTGNTDSELNLRLQLRYTRDLYAGALWEKRLELYPSLTDLGDLRMRYETALWVPLTPRLKLKVNAAVGYDNEPKLRGLHEWESSVGASVSLDF